MLWQSCDFEKHVKSENISILMRNDKHSNAGGGLTYRHIVLICITVLQPV